MVDDDPTPGSLQAKEMGCLCSGEMLGRGHAINNDCPLHGLPFILDLAENQTVPFYEYYTEENEAELGQLIPAANPSEER